MEDLMRDEVLDRMLAVTLAPPRLPADLQARVTATVAQDAARDSEKLRTRLQDEHKRSIARLHRQLRHECAEAFIFACCIFIPVRFGVRSLSFWLVGRIGYPSPMLIESLLFVLAIAAAALIWIPLVGPARSVRLA